MIKITEPIVIVFAIIAAVVLIVFSSIRKRNRQRVGLDVAFIALLIFYKILTPVSVLSKNELWKSD